MTIPIPENDWVALNIKLNELNKKISNIHTTLEEILRERILVEEEPIIITGIEEEPPNPEGQGTPPEEEEWNGPGSVYFDTTNSNFDGEWPVLYWERLDGKNLEYEIRTNLNFGEKSGLVAVVKDHGDYVVKSWKPSDGRSATFYIKARDSEKRYSRIYDTITLSNSAPSMAGFSPVVTVSKNDRNAVVDWSAWTGFTATDLDGFKIYYSTESVCTITDTNLYDKVGKSHKKAKVTKLTKGITYDFRVVPCDVFGDGTASD